MNYMLQTSVEDLPITEEEFYSVFVKFGIERPPNMGRRIVETMPFLDNLKRTGIIEADRKKKTKKKTIHSSIRFLAFSDGLRRW